MDLFVKCIRNGSTWYAQYSGLDQDAVIAALHDLGCSNVSFISGDEFVLANPPKER